MSHLRRDRSAGAGAAWFRPAVLAALAALLLGASCAPASQLATGGAYAPVPIRPDGSDVMDNGCDGGADGIDWDFAWSVVPRATRYHLQAWSITPANPALDDSSLTAPFWRRTDPLAFVRESSRIGWRWRVRAFADGQWGEWSRETVFDFEPAGTDCP